MKKTKSKSKKSAKKLTKKKTSGLVDTADESGIVVIDDDFTVDTEKELEERRAYLEEARSQDASE